MIDIWTACNKTQTAQETATMSCNDTSERVISKALRRAPYDTEDGTCSDVCAPDGAEEYLAALAPHHEDGL